MMNDFDLDKMVKRTPCDVPEGFFDRFPDRMMRRIAAERARRRRWRLTVAVSTMAALLVGVVFFVRTGTNEAALPINGVGTVSAFSEQMDAYISHLSDEELAEQFDYYAADVTLTLYDDME